MNSQHRAIRSLLSSMAPRRAVGYIQSFQLRPDEEAVLVECDVHGLSYIQAADKLHLSPEAIKERKRRAYSKIVDAMAYEKEKGQGD